MGEISTQQTRPTLMKRFFTVDGVTVSLEGDDTFYVEVNGKREVTGSKNSDKTWDFWDTGSYIGSFDSFADLWSHVEDLVALYRLFPNEWREKYFHIVSSLFKTVK